MSRFDRFNNLMRLATAVLVTVIFAACRFHRVIESPFDSQSPTLISPIIQPSGQPTSQPSAEPTVQLLTPALMVEPLISSGLNLSAGPVDVPLELQIPALHTTASVLAVGLTQQNVMDAPIGPLNDPVWQKVFWYRGSGLPGASGTATFAGHVDDGRGRPAVFAHLMDLRLGDLIIIHDLRSDLDINFTVVSATIYSRQQAVDPKVLAQIYGPGPVAGHPPQPAVDGLSHLTLITCAGDFVGGSFDHRLVIYATRSN